MIRILAWVVAYFFASIAAEFLLEVTKVLSSGEDRRPAIPWFVVLGLAGGLATAGPVPDRMLPPGPFTGVSVFILPIVLAGGMSLVGWARGAARSHLASWYGGASLGLGLAVGRLIGLAFVAEVRAV